MLVNGVSLDIASLLIKNTTSVRSTINRKFHEWIDNKIIYDTYNKIQTNYMNNNIITEAYIDSTDIMNANCDHKYTGKSIKLKKQALKLSFICDQNKVPISPYQLDKPIVHDSRTGFEVIIQTNMNNNKPTNLAGDKGYILDKQTREQLLKTKGIRLICPKKKYIKKKVYKTKNYKYIKERIRHSKQMKNTLTNRIYVEHTNNAIHRSFKRLDKIFDRKIESFEGFIDLAFSIITLMKTI